MFKVGEKILLVLTKKYFELYQEGSEQNERVEFSSKEKFKELVVELLARTNLKKQMAVLLLGESVVYKKEGIVKEESDKEILLEQFENNIPFDPAQTQKIEIPGDPLQLIAVNKEVYETLEGALAIFGWSLSAVLPASLFEDFREGRSLRNEEVSQILNSSQDIQKFNLLKTPKLKQSSVNSKYKLTALVFSIGLIIVALVFARSYLNDLKQRLNKNSSQKKLIILPKTSPVFSPAASPISSSSAQISKKDLRVEVLNGTGILGQATEIKSLLEGLGYKDITVGNTLKTPETTLETSASVSGVLRDEIVLELKKTLTDIKIKSLEETDKYDIIVITGK